jgi:hypothetical protein
MPATARSASLAAMCHVVQGASAIIQSPGDLAAMHGAIHARCAELLRCARVHVFIAHGESRGKSTLHTRCANGHATTITAYGKRAGLLGATAADFMQSASACDPLASFGGLVMRVDSPEDHPLFDDSVDIVPSSGCCSGFLYHEFWLSNIRSRAAPPPTSLMIVPILAPKAEGGCRLTGILVAASKDDGGAFTSDDAQLACVLSCVYGIAVQVHVQRSVCSPYRFRLPSRALSQGMLPLVAAAAPPLPLPPSPSSEPPPASSDHRKQAVTSPPPPAKQAHAVLHCMKRYAWLVTCGVCCVLCDVCGVWCVVCGVWCVVCGVWCVVCGVWCVVCGVCGV